MVIDWSVVIFAVALLATLAWVVASIMNSDKIIFDTGWRGFMLWAASGIMLTVTAVAAAMRAMGVA